MKKSIQILTITVLLISTATAQVGINDDNSVADPSAILDLKSSTKGFLPPRMSSSQISAIQNPANGLQVFCTSDSKMYIYLASLGQWKELCLGTATITPPFSCGMPITISHVAGAVAPVNKTTTYGTVTNIPGESSKCWITSNLGSDQQATAVNDSTEPSAGWYWQFNRKQGYKRDETTLTPTYMVSMISENSDWVTANDPCSIELGAAWRVPSPSEWYNVDEAGGWTTWDGPWNSALKLHATGYLSPPEGLMFNRGSFGFYWSSTQVNSAMGWFLGFQSLACYLYPGSLKELGHSLRCISGCDSPSSPTQGTNIPSQNQIIWNWNIVNGATGYKWNTTSNYSTAMDMGTATSYTETALTCNTAYTRYVWAYNACGYSLATTLTQTTSSCAVACGQPVTDPRDGKVYSTILIGSQCWFSQNLNIGTRISLPNQQANNGGIEKYCYNDNEANCDLYGGIYLWNELMNYGMSGIQGICPSGWHVPSDQEWCTLLQSIDPTVNCSATTWTGTDAGLKMKSTTGWVGGGNGNNASGFNVLPAGGVVGTGFFDGQGWWGHFWTSTLLTSPDSWRYGFEYYQNKALRATAGYWVGYPCRCIRD